MSLVQWMRPAHSSQSQDQDKKRIQVWFKTEFKCSWSRPWKYSPGLGLMAESSFYNYNTALWEAIHKKDWEGEKSI